MCKTQYVISEDIKADRIRLTKTKDLNHCQERIMKDIGLAYSEKCVECEAVRDIYFLTFGLTAYFYTQCVCYNCCWGNCELCLCRAEWT